MKKYQNCFTSRLPISLRICMKNHKTLLIRHVSIKIRIYKNGVTSRLPISLRICITNHKFRLILHFERLIPITFLLKSYQIINSLDEVERRFYFASLLIMMLFLLSNLHYQVMFQVGVMEIFAIHMAYIVSLAFRSHKMPTDH